MSAVVVCRTFTVSLIVASTNISYPVPSAQSVLPPKPTLPASMTVEPLSRSLRYSEKGFDWFSRHVYAGFHICVYHPLCYNASTSLRHPGWKLRRCISLLSGGEAADQRAWSSKGVPPDSLYGCRGEQLLLRLYGLAGTSCVGALAPVFPFLQSLNFSLHPML